MQQETKDPMACRVCGGLVINFTEDEQGQFDLIPLHNRGKCIACKRTHIIHRRNSGEIITVTIM